MASTKIEVVYTWENNVRLKVTTQEDDNPKLTVLDMDENGCISSLWGYVEGIINTTHANMIKRIGDEMKA